MKTKLLFISLLFFFCLTQVKTQTKDSLTIATDSSRLANKKIYKHAKRATVMSIILPGLGQAYNRKYWKIPIIYAGLGAFGYMFVKNNQEYNFYKENLIAVYDNDPNTINSTPYDEQQLQILKDQYKKSRDFGIIGMSIIYVLNIIDANVDGHLRSFDVSDDLSLNIDPWQHINYSTKRIASGLSLTLTFK